MSRHAARKTIDYYNLPESSVHALHAGINVDFDEHSSKPHVRDYILFVGRDFERKGGDLLLASFDTVRKHYDIDLVIAGPKQWVVKDSIPENVVFLGDVHHSIIKRYFAHARLFVMPSRFEAFGIAFSEALCNGVPVIARDAYAMPEIITHGENGYLLSGTSESAEELAELIARALDNEELKQKVKANKSQYREYYSWDRVAKDMIEIITRDLEG